MFVPNISFGSKKKCNEIDIQFSKDPVKKMKMSASL
jgi:hypothetical protein